MTIKYSIPATVLTVGMISGNAFAGDLTNNNNDLRNEYAVGYQFGFNDSYHVALEVFGQRPTTETRANQYSYSHEEPTPVDDNEIWGLNDGRTDLDWSTGIRLRPGYNVTGNTSLFLDGGIVWGDFNMELADADAIGAAQFDDALLKNDLVRGFRYGAGIEHSLSKVNNLSLVLDYSMTEFDNPNNNANYNSSDNLNDGDQFAPAYQQVMLSVKADFAPGLGF